MAALGTKENPISRLAFAEKWLPILQKQHADPEYTFQKVTPTLLLTPSDLERSTQPMYEEVPPEMQVFMYRSATGQTFQEAMLMAHGKALLMNVCTPFLEVYPKDEDGCKQMFDSHNMISDEYIVPETNSDDLARFLQIHMMRANPLTPYEGVDYEAIARCMVEYRTCLRRTGIPWRLVYNKDDTSVVAVKLTRSGIEQLLLALGRVVPYGGEKLYREESYTPFFEFSEGDYVVIDIDPATNDVKFDKDSVPLVRTVNGVAFETTYNRALLGSRVNPIPRTHFVNALLPIMTALANDPTKRYLKVAPTLVLYPNVEEMDANGDPLPSTEGGMQYQVATDLRTMLLTKSGQTFSEAMMKAHGKALLINFCTPFLEAYPKDKKHCAMIYDMTQLDSAVVPESSIPELAQYIASALTTANPLTPYTALDANRVAQSMMEYRKALGREGMPWRMALNKQTVTAVACKLGRAEINAFLIALGRTVPFNGERLYRAESYDSKYEFGEGDWLLMDVDPVTNNFKYDKDNNPLVRTVNETAFECTYNTVVSRM